MKNFQTATHSTHFLCPKQTFTPAPHFDLNLINPSYTSKKRKKPPRNPYSNALGLIPLQRPFPSFSHFTTNQGITTPPPSIQTLFKSLTRSLNALFSPSNSIPSLSNLLIYLFANTSTSALLTLLASPPPPPPPLSPLPSSTPTPTPTSLIPGTEEEEGGAGNSSFGKIESKTSNCEFNLFRYCFSTWL